MTCTDGRRSSLGALRSVRDACRGLVVSGLPVLYPVPAVRRMSASLEHTVDRAGLRPSGPSSRPRTRPPLSWPASVRQRRAHVHRGAGHGARREHAPRVSEARQARRALRPGRRRHEEDLGDVLFGIETYEGWASTFADHEIHMRDFFYMINKVLERLGTKAAPARAVLRLAKFADERPRSVVSGGPTQFRQRRAPHQDPSGA